MSRASLLNQQDQTAEGRQEMTSLQTPRCPHMQAASNEQPEGDRPRLMRMSEVERAQDPDSSLTCIAAWTRAFLARPHPQLGRKGAVCPFVPLSLVMDSIWLAEVSEPDASFESISQIITEYRDLFLKTEPTTGSDSLQKAFMIVFPTLGPDGAALVDKVQYALKKFFVDMGLMLGEFHAANEGEGLRNPDFRPLRSPVPMLAIRHMVESDLPFLMRESYPAAERSSFLRSYLSRMGRGLTPHKFGVVLDRLIAAEIEVWVASATAAGHVQAAQLPVPGQAVRELRRSAAQPVGASQ